MDRFEQTWLATSLESLKLAVTTAARQGLLEQAEAKEVLSKANHAFVERTGEQQPSR